MYLMRMARVNITVPDDLLSRARAAGLNVSRVAAAALSEELDQRAKTAELDRYLREPVDAVVAALAGSRPDTVVLTSDPLDLRELAAHTALPISVIGV